MAGSPENPQPLIAGRCYCGAISFVASAPPETVVYCHCEDCRRATGAPVAAFAAFEEGALAFTPDEGEKVALGAGAERSFCPTCGSSLTGRYAYLPGQVYVSLGVVDQAADLAPRVHAHEDQRLPWLHIEDDLKRETGSAAKTLQAAKTNAQQGGDATRTKA